MRILTTPQKAKIAILYNEGFSAPAIGRKNKLSVDRIYTILRNKKIPRRNASLNNRIRFINSPLSFKFCANISGEKRGLFIAALMLYLSEGAKTGSTVDFVNSDPRILKVFIRFLRDICGINEKKLRLYLYCFSDQNIEELKKFWAVQLNIGIDRFTKPYVREPSGKNNRIMPWGVLHIRYNDKRLLEKILTLCSDLLVKLIGAGTEAVKRDRLSKGSL